MYIRKTGHKQALDSIDAKLKEKHKNRILVDTDEFDSFFTEFYNRDVEQIKYDYKGGLLYPAMYGLNNIQDFYKFTLEKIHNESNYEYIAIPLKNIGGALTFVLDHADTSYIKGRLDKMLFGMLNLKKLLNDTKKEFESEIDFETMPLMGETFYSPKGRIIIPFDNPKYEARENLVFSYEPLEVETRINPANSKFVLDAKNNKLNLIGTPETYIDANMLVFHKKGDIAIKLENVEKSKSIDEIVDCYKHLMTPLTIGKNCEKYHPYGVSVPMVVEKIMDKV